MENVKYSVNHRIVHTADQYSLILAFAGKSFDEVYNPNHPRHSNTTVSWLAYPEMLENV